MVNEVNKIIRLEFNSIIADGPNTMLLLGLYSKLYLNGQAPRTCKAQMFKYFNELKRTGIMKAETKQKIKERTLVPNWNGKKYLRGGAIIDSNTITDEQAFNLLDKEVLDKKDFKTLPKKKVEKKEVKKADKKA